MILKNLPVIKYSFVIACRASIRYALGDCLQLYLVVENSEISCDYFVHELGPVGNHYDASVHGNDNDWLTKHASAY